MENFICVQCGTQFSEMAKPPLRCPICEDERQFVRHGGQEWTTLKRLAADHQNRFEEEAPQLLGLGTEPEFAIGQRAMLVQSPSANWLWDNLTLINCGGHFEGGTVLHWSAGENGKGALLTGDIIQVVQDRRYVSFMRSYPNLIPLGAAAVDHILKAIEPFPFDQIYGAWWKANVLSDAKAAVARSAARYLRAIEAGASYG